MRYDLLIRDGLLLDGSGSAGVPGDIAIAAGRIAAVGPKLEAEAAKTIDATGLAVAPGFIDIKTHSDFTLPINPKAESKVRQGVTTEIIGHCGFSVAPALPGGAAAPDGPAKVITDVIESVCGICLDTRVSMIIVDFTDRYRSCP